MKSLSRAQLFATPWTVACTKLLGPWDFLGKSTGVGCHFLFQGIFPTQGSNPGLQHCRQTLHHLSHQGSPPLKRNTAIQLIRKTTCITKYICFLNYKHNECSLKKSWTVQKGMLILSLSRTKQHYKNVLELLSVNFDAYIVPLHTHFSFLFFSFFFFTQMRSQCNPDKAMSLHGPLQCGCRKKASPNSTSQNWLEGIMYRPASQETRITAPKLHFKV